MEKSKSVNYGKIIGISFGVILFAFILFWVGVVIGQGTPNDIFNLDTVNSLTGNLKEEGNISSFTCTLPDEFEDAQSVMFKASHAEVRITVGGKEVYTAQTEAPLFGKSHGSFWHIVELPADSAGQELVVTRISVYSTYHGPDAEFYYGSRGDCILKLVSNFIYILVMNSISIVLGVICFLLQLRALIRKETNAGHGFLWIGLFAVLIAIWSLRQAGFVRFLVPYSQFLYFIDIHTLFFAPVALDMFVYSISKSKWGKSCLWFVPVYLFGALFGTLMQMVGVFDLRQMLTVLHVFIGINALYMIFAIHREAWKNKGSAARRFCIPLYTMLAFGIMEMIHFYAPWRTTSIFLPTGVMVFVLMLVWQQVSSYFHTLEEQKLMYYEKFANTDMLTGALNRNAYETALKNLAAEEAMPEGRCAALFDLNNLKFINDHFGHEKGDEAIKCCYELIVTAFGNRENCYRIGGDEFVYLGAGDIDFEAKMANFNGLVAAERERLEYPFNVSLGYAVFDAAQDKDMQDTIKRSDAMMYRDKEKKKQLDTDSSRD